MLCGVPTAASTLAGIVDEAVGTLHSIPWLISYVRILVNTMALALQLQRQPGISVDTKKKELIRAFKNAGREWCPRGEPDEVIVNLTANAVTTQGLNIQAELGTGAYSTGIKVRDAELTKVNLKRAEFRGDWSYCVLPKRYGK